MSARHESSIAQWLEGPTGILEGPGFYFRWRTQKIYFLSNSNWERFFKIYFVFRSVVLGIAVIIATAS